MALPIVGDGQQAGDGNTSETLNVGRSGQPVQFGGTNTATVGFYGATPVAQQSGAGQAAAASTAAASISATQWGFSTSTQANAVITLVNQLRSDLVDLGLIKGS